MTNRTDAIGLHRPDFNESPWHDEVNENFEIMDATLKSLLGVESFKGKWLNSTAVTVGQRYYDTVSSLFYEVLIDHTTAASPTIFSEDRTDNPTYWKEISLAGTLEAASNAITKAEEAATSAEAAATSAAAGAVSASNSADSATASVASAVSAETSNTNAAANSAESLVQATAAANSATVANNAASLAQELVYPNGPPANIAHTFFQGS